MLRHPTDCYLLLREVLNFGPHQQKMRKARTNRPPSLSEKEKQTGARTETPTKTSEGNKEINMAMAKSPFPRVRVSILDFAGSIVPQIGDPRLAAAAVEVWTGLQTFGRSAGLHLVAFSRFMQVCWS